MTIGFGSRVAALASGLAMFALTAAPASAQIEVGSAAPHAMVETLEGKAVDLASYFGDKPVVLEFWATWCPVCAELEPAMREAASVAGDDAKFIAVGVSVNQSPARIKAWQAKHKMPMSFLFDRKGEATGAYDVFATSTVVVVDTAGKVVYVGQGGDQNVSAALAKAGAGGKP
jgi:peroxiredoxin